MKCLFGRLLLLLAGAALISCGGGGVTPKTPSPVATRDAADPAYTLSSARRQVSFLRIELPPRPAAGAFTRMEIASATAPERWTPSRITLFAGTPRSATAAGPVVDQLVGAPTTAVDAGTVLAVVPQTDGQDVRAFTLPTGSPDHLELFLRIEVPALMAPGEYTFGLSLAAADGTRVESSLRITVSDITLPSDTRVIALATAAVDEMAAAYPDIFGKLQATYLDRNDPDNAAAVAQLDAIVRTAQRNGVSFYLEDTAPSVKIDEVGRVIVEWEAYDRVVGPYLDGSAFADRMPLPVWLAPAPPRRIRDTPTQLRQYLQSCAEHYREKGWTQQPAFMHAALVDPDASPDLRKQVLEVIERHLDRSFVLVGTPDVTSSLKAMWVVPEDDTRLPPANKLASMYTVRAWPWMCAARGLRGMVWRHAVQTAGGKDAGSLPLLSATAATGKEDAIEPEITLRLAWLTDGLNDTAHFGLVEKRTDPAVANELLAGVVGRTGLAAREGPAAAGYLYAGWPTNADVWRKLPAMLDSLIQANDPGKNMPADDPQLLAAKIFLAQSHRPVARVAGYRFGVSQGRDGTVVDVTTEFLVENPLGIASRMDLQWPLPPGDFIVNRADERDRTPTNEGKLEVPAYGLVRVPLKLSGHLDSVREAPRLSPLQLIERANGASLELSALVPVYRMRPTQDPPKIDGTGSDWRNDAYFQAFGPMRVELGYQSRASLLGGKIRKAENAAEARWAFDPDYVYALIRCPQTNPSDERSSEWPTAGGTAGGRWWGTDGIQLQIAGGGAGGVSMAPGTRVVHLAVKPSGIVLMKAATISKDGTARWTEASLPGLKHAVSSDKNGYAVELAIPRSWFPKDHDQDPTVAVWRVNVLRHLSADLMSTSWSGPVVGDSDLPMMGLLIGGE